MTEASVPFAIQSLPLFRGLTDDEAQQISGYLKLRQFTAGQTVLKQGESSQALWVVLKGTCEVARQSENRTNESVALAALEPTNYFGEMSFFSPAPHSASVRARTDVMLLQLARSDYDVLIGEGAWAAYKVAYNVLQGVAGRLRHMDEWVARLAAEHNIHTDGELPHHSEWLEFRDKLFKGWNL